MRHIISVLLENEAGALSRVAGLFTARGYNIESLTVALVTRGSESVIEQITKQLNKLVDAVKLVDLTEGLHIERELLLMKVKASNNNQREEAKRLVDIFQGRIIDVSENSYVLEVTGRGEKIEAFIKAIEPSLIIEVVRTGASGIGRGNRSLQV